MMDCVAAEEMVIRYISHDLSVQEMEDFLNHIEKCPSCYEELQTYFIVNEALDQLADGGETETDFRRLLENDIRKSRRTIFLKRLKHSLIASGTILACAAIVGFLLFRIF